MASTIRRKRASGEECAGFTTSRIAGRLSAEGPRALFGVHFGLVVVIDSVRHIDEEPHRFVSRHHNQSSPSGTDRTGVMWEIPEPSLGEPVETAARRRSNSA